MLQDIVEYTCLWTLECSMAMATMSPPMKSMQEDFMKYMLVWAVVIMPAATEFQYNNLPPGIQTEGLFRKTNMT